ncbi:MAG: hypothetical protein PHU80_05755 [Kiritimatiellae bacterium]|nr:hypothetical protein [Kiritimatiellia bacterium]
MRLHFFHWQKVLPVEKRGEVTVCATARDMRGIPGRASGRKSTGGFTYTEVLMATALTALVMSQVAVALHTSLRVCEAAVADMELALYSRELREKMLFNLNPDEGGLMNVSQSEITVEDNQGRWGGSLRFKPAKGPPNRIRRANNKKFAMDRGRAGWLSKGRVFVQSEDVFSLVSSNGTIEVNLDVAIEINGRKYEQRNQFPAQILNR